MAFLPMRLQRILYARLKHYNCVSKQHPEGLQDYGGVVICSGGCYKSLADWFYLGASLFKADFTAAATHPLLFEVTGAPSCLLANGTYLRTTDLFNGYPVYAQINQRELDKLKTCITDQQLMTYLLSNAPNLSDSNLRAGERLLVRGQNAWVVQSVTAYRGYTVSGGTCGFHVLQLPDSNDLVATCFEGMSLDLQSPIMRPCSAAKLRSKKWGIRAFKSAAEFVFSFGSKRCVTPQVRKGSNYKPHPTRLQQFHTDGPIERGSMWDENSKLDCDAAVLQSLSTLTITELKACCLSRDLAQTGSKVDLVNRLSEWLDRQPKIPVPVHDTMFQSLSALFAFFTDTALGVPRQGTRESLKLDIAMGTAVLFRFDFIHQGWKCVVEDDPRELPVHFRAHFYLFNGVLSELPTYDLESTLEYLSIVSHFEPVDDATGLLMLECLQTFVPWNNAAQVGDLSLKNLDVVAASRGYRLFNSQQALSTHIGTCSTIADQPSSKKRKRQL